MKMEDAIEEWNEEAKRETERTMCTRCHRMEKEIIQEEAER